MSFYSALVPAPSRDQPQVVREAKEDRLLQQQEVHLLQFRVAPKLEEEAVAVEGRNLLALLPRSNHKMQ